MNWNLDDNIVAIATPPGTGAIGMIRLSGKDAIQMANNIFKGTDLNKADGHTIHFGKLINPENEIIDECLVSIFRAPKSYTKEDIIEFSCHGSPYILNKVLQILIDQGARLARPGEFTLRAFLNGQMDLAQAEAVADLIAADSKVSHDLAMKQMRGGFSTKIRELRQELIQFASLIELELDFSEEDVEFADRDRLMDLVKEIQRIVHQLLESFELGNVLKKGIPTVIAGRPNAGKSTLLNILLAEDRAIVSDIPGTTRDTIQEVLNIQGIQFRLVDTAGIRETSDVIERSGVDRTLNEISKSSVVLYLFDVIETRPEDLWKDIDLFMDQNEAIDNGRKILYVANKMDLNPYIKPASYFKDGLITKENLITLSAKNHMNIEYLKDKLVEVVLGGHHLQDETVVTNSRHFQALSAARTSLDQVIEGIRSGISNDLTAIDIRQALHALGEITGEVTTDDLLDNIFSNFCIGK